MLEVAKHDMIMKKDNMKILNKVNKLLEEYNDIVHKETLKGLPLKGKIMNTIDLVSNATLPNNAAHGMNPMECT